MRRQGGIDMTKKLKSLMMLSMVVAMLLAQLNFVEAGHLEDISARGIRAC